MEFLTEINIDEDSWEDSKLKLEENSNYDKEEEEDNGFATAAA